MEAEEGFILALLVLVLGMLAALAIVIPTEAESGLTQKWECSDEMTMYVDIPNDGQGPVEGYHCERVPKGGK